MNFPSHELMPVIRAALERGQRVRLTANGSSMLPFIRNGDVVELEPVYFLPRTGDVVLVQCPGKRYVLHRVVRVKGEEFFLRGDAQRYCEGPFTFRDVLGRAVLSCRRGRTRVHNRGVWRLAGLVWTRCAPPGQWLFRLAGRVREIGGRVLRLLQSKH